MNGIDQRDEEPGRPTSGCALLSEGDRHLYVAQREAFIGFDDSDCGMRLCDIRAMARRWGLSHLLIDIDVTAGIGEALAYPGLQLVRFHPVAMVRWIAAHEIAHLLVGPVEDPGVPHGPVFVRHLLAVIAAECGPVAAQRLRARLHDHVVQQTSSVRRVAGRQL